jgi:hypothetical protein
MLGAVQGPGYHLLWANRQQAGDSSRLDAADWKKRRWRIGGQQSHRFTPDHHPGRPGGSLTPDLSVPVGRHRQVHTATTSASRRGIDAARLRSASCSDPNAESPVRSGDVMKLCKKETAVRPKYTGAPQSFFDTARRAARSHASCPAVNRFAYSALRLLGLTR